MENTSESDSNKLKNTLMNLRRDKSLILTDSKNIEKKAEEGAVIILKGSPRFVLILYAIFLLIIGIMISIWVFGFNFMDWNTLLIVFSVWFGTGVLFVIGTMSNLIILHPDGFLIRRYIFFKFSQKWKNLTQSPHVGVETDPQGGKWYNIVFTIPFRKKRMNTSHLKITDKKKFTEKMEFIGKILLVYYDRSQKL